jgi:hypothetical protein
MIGLEEFVIPDEESRTKQYREIAQLVAEAPVVVRSDDLASANVECGGLPPLSRAGARSGAAGEASLAQETAGASSRTPHTPVVEVVLPSIMPDEFADNHATELEICMRWFSSDAGQVAKIEAPAGYANVRAHAMFHREYLLKQQRQATQASAATADAPVRP